MAPLPDRVIRYFADPKPEAEIQQLAERQRTLQARLPAAQGRRAAALHYNRYDEHERAQAAVTQLEEELATVSKLLGEKVAAREAEAAEIRQILQQQKTAAAQPARALLATAKATASTPMRPAPPRPPTPLYKAEPLGKRR